jgi:glycosyltransferase involved in cell wall biosynthesis
MASQNVTNAMTVTDPKSAGRESDLSLTKQSEYISVCIVVENLPAPIDRRVWLEACTLRDAGYIVSVICPKGKESYKNSYEILDGIHIYRHWVWEASTAVGYMVEYTLALVAESYLILKVFARTRFRILHACNPPDTICLIGLILKIFGVRFIFDHHDLVPELFELKFGRRNGLLWTLTRLAEKCSFKISDVSIATNESFKEIAVTRGKKRPQSVFVVRTCPDLALLRRALPRTEIKHGKPLLVVYVGFMGKQDGLDLLLESIEHIVTCEKRKDAHYVLVGGGTILPELRRMVVIKELDSFVTFTGEVSHDEVAHYLFKADIGVAPDPKSPMNDNSTMIKIFEYMAFGLPVVLFDLKEGRHAAGGAALYATPNDPIDFANQLMRLLDCSKLRMQLGACGRKRIEESLNWESEKKALLRAYEAALQAN